MDIENTNSSSNNKNKHNDRHSSNTDGEDGYVAVGLPMHGQAMKIKNELEKFHHPSSEQLEVRRIICKINRQRSRSPLGVANRPIWVGK